MAKKICPSDFKHLIAIQNRKTLPDNAGVDFKLEFDAGIKAWAMIKTTRGSEFMGDLNIARDGTHIFTMRYIPAITAQNWVLYDERRFDILHVENIDEENRFLKLRCNERGSTDFPRTGH